MSRPPPVGIFQSFSGVFVTFFPAVTLSVSPFFLTFSTSRSIMGEGEDYDYEALPESSSPATHMMAGAAAGMFEHVAMYPFDSIKTRLQRLNPTPESRYRGVMDAFTRMTRGEGYLSVYRGVVAVASGAGPAHALYFASYEKAKEVFGATRTDDEQHHHVATAAAAVVATLAHDAFMNPMEVIKQRLQMFNSPYRGMVHCGTSILQTEGVSAFYRSFTTQIIMNIPYQITQLVTYEFLRKKLNPKGDYDPKTHFIAGGVAGAVASGITTPLDVAKTLLNTQEPCPGAQAAQEVLPTAKAQPRPIVGVFNALSTIYRINGLAGFAKGFYARVMFTTPAAAISWSVYEFFKHWLSLEEPVAPIVVASSAAPAPAAAGKP